MNEDLVGSTAHCCASSQEANGGVPSLNASRERSSGATMQGGVASEKEAVLLGKY